MPPLPRLKPQSVTVVTDAANKKEDDRVTA